jgi:hypothetical protein
MGDRPVARPSPGAQGSPAFIGGDPVDRLGIGRNGHSPAIFRRLARIRLLGPIRPRLSIARQNSRRLAILRCASALGTAQMNSCHRMRPIPFSGPGDRRKAGQGARRTWQRT